MQIRFKKSYRAAEDGNTIITYEKDQIVEASQKLAEWAIGDGAAEQVEEEDPAQKDGEEKDETDEEETTSEKAKTETHENKASGGAPRNKGKR